tara:strand:- start:307 stop:1257 length:951 start_codon:yes stop_codon:yes gene_type:complete
MNKNNRAFICGVKGLNLTQKEKIFLKKYKPWGVILFSRNIKSIKQVQNLTNSIKKIFNNKYYPILIDEEGGRVSRLKKIFTNTSFNSDYFGKLYNKNRKLFNLYFYLHVKQVSYLLNLLGININTVPVLDLKHPRSHKVIGNRAYSSNARIVSTIGDICLFMYKKFKICNVIKHIPGHGLSKVDSHFSLPVIRKKKKYLIRNDFSTFKNKKSLLAMTAHIIYNDIDSLRPATHSNKIIKFIRKQIGFKNLIISDDISMKALKYDIKMNTIKAFTAGCNIVLHCNGNLKEMNIVAKNSPYVDNFIKKKTLEFKNIVK